MERDVDLRKRLAKLYAPSGKEFSLVEVPPLNFLMVDGHGDPNHAPAYGEAIQALYSLAYTLKFTIKRELSADFRVMPLEGLWWTEDMADFSVDNKDAWDWTAMIAQPEMVTPERFEAARAEVAKKKRLPALAKVRLETYAEGLSVQIMHLGPYAAEAPTIARLHGTFLPENGLGPAGKHHEIYLSDPGRTAQEKLKTIIRQPVRRM